MSYAIVSVLAFPLVGVDATRGKKWKQRCTDDIVILSEDFIIAVGRILVRETIDQIAQALLNISKVRIDLKLDI